MMPAEWLAPLRAQLAPARERYDALQPRERKMVLAASVAIALALVFLVVWQPVVTARERGDAALHQARETANQIEQLAARAPKPKGSTPAKAAANAGRSLLTIVDLASRGVNGLAAPTRLQPDGEKKVRVWFEHTSFDALVQWIGKLHAQHGITVVSADIGRGNPTGTVDARFSLQGQP